MYTGNKSSFFGLALAVGSFSLYQVSSVAWWVWVLLIIVLIILVYLIISGSGKKEAPAVEQPQVTAAVEPEPEQEPMVVTPEDLSRIEGIGPKINQFLHDAGIQTFAQLAEYDMEALDKMLAEAKLRLADPSTWAEQAKFAAAGDWEALKKLQDNLKGGRRV